MAAHRHHRRSSSLRIKPLVLALAGAFPLVNSWAGAQDTRLPVQHGTFTPTGSHVTVSTSGANMNVTQQDQRAITQWSSFNVGRDASVTFNMPNANSAMLARVLPTKVAPQQILGAVRTQYVDAAGQARVGGELFLINAGGWLFGTGATVNVGGLVASSLDVLNSDFLNGLTSLNSAAASFSWKYAGGVDNADANGKYAPGLYQADGLVQVSAGAKITTESGGRVFLFAPKVVNKGEITTPGGQTVLAGGGEVYLNDPQREKLYATESNENVSALKGLLVEVNNGPEAGQEGSVTNAGLIDSMHGNTTLVAMLVRQSGKIRAATGSGSDNSSVLLAARSNVIVKRGTNAGEVSKQATVGGSLVLSAGSSIEMLPDDSGGTTARSTPFYAPVVELSGKTIDLMGSSADNVAGALIRAPGATVNVRAAVSPVYEGYIADKTIDNRDKFGVALNGADEADARITVGAKAVIDVSGTTTAEVDAAKRNFVQPSLVTNSDLKDAPLQKLGPVFHAEDAVFDVRQDVPMFSSTQGYKDAAKVTVTERLAQGGAVNLSSTGVVATHASSTINVSGGQVNYSAVGLTPGQAPVLLTQLQDASGKLYTLNTAPGDRVYTLAAPRVVQEAAYVQGADAGRLNVRASQVLMAGALTATTVAGTRQQAGLDPLAQGAKVKVEAWLQQPKLAGVDLNTALTRLNMDIGQQAQGAASTYWDALGHGTDDAATTALLPAGSVLNPSIVNSQASEVHVETDGGLHWLAGNDKTFVPGAKVTLIAHAGDGLQMDSSLRDAGGTVSLQARDLLNGGSTVAFTKGLSVADGKFIDVSGRYVNQYQDGDLVAPQGVAGGDIDFLSDGALTLGLGSLLDVSGGAVLTRSQDLLGKAAGQLRVLADQSLSVGVGGLLSRAPSQVALLGELRGYSLTQGGSLSLAAGSIDIGGTNPERQSGLYLSPSAFDNQGFGSIDLNGITSLNVAEGTQLLPQQRNWLALPGLNTAATGTALSRLVKVYDKGAAWRNPTNLSLRSTQGGITVAQGALIQTDELAKVALQATSGIDFEGHIIDHGGQVLMGLSTNGDLTNLKRDQDGVIWLGQDSLIDVSGVSVVDLGTGSLHQGHVLDGGDITLDANQTGAGGFVAITQGARLKLNGASDTFDVRVAGARGSVMKKVLTGSAGGTLSVTAAHGAVLEGDVQAQGGSAQALDGSLMVKVRANNISEDSGVTPESAFAPHTYRITLQADAPTLSAGLGYAARGALLARDDVWGNATVSSALLNQGADGAAPQPKFADVTLVAGDRIDLGQSATIAAKRSLTLSAQAIHAAGDQRLTLSAPYVSLGSALRNGADSGQDFSPAASHGQGVLNVAALYVDLNDQLSLQGLGQLNILGLGGTANAAATAVALRSSNGAPAQLLGMADIDIRAGQVFPNSDVNYTIDASGYKVRFSGGDPSLAKPLSAGGQLTVKAADIEQGGVLRAPFGHLTLDAPHISLGDGSETSVSGAGLLVPFGSTINGSSWTYASATDVRTNLLGKAISIEAGDSGTVQVSDTAVIDAQGGGDVYAREFVAGPGGSQDIFTGAAGGAFAVVPLASANQMGFAVYDRAILTADDASGARASINPGQQITFGANGLLPAGTYVVLPASYASMPGAFLVKADTATTRAGAADLGAAAVQLEDGALSVVGKIGYAGTSYQDTLASRFIVMNNAQSGSHSQINLSSGAGFFAAAAAKQGGVAPQSPMDGGDLRIHAASLDKLATGVLKLGGDTYNNLGLGGQLILGVQQLHIGDTVIDDAAVSNVSVAALNRSGVRSAILGGLLEGGNAAGEHIIKVTASHIDMDASSQSQAGGLALGDVTLVATDAVTLHEGASIVASGVGAEAAYHVEGDGAALRVSASADASLTRAGSEQAAGNLTLMAGATVASPQGKVLLDSAHAMGLDKDAHFLGNALSLAAPRLAVGDEGTATSDAVQLDGELLAQLGLVHDLSLRSYSSIDFYKPGTAGGGHVDTLTLGSTALDKLSLDAGTLQGHDGVSVDVLAGTVTLANTSGAAFELAKATSGTGQLRVLAQAAQGDINVRTGFAQGDAVQAANLGVAGFQQVQLKAQRNVVMDGHGDTTDLQKPDAGAGGLQVAGDVALAAANLTATTASNTVLQATGHLAIGGNGAVAEATGLGAHLRLQADTISQTGVVALHSGGLTMQATGAGASGAPALAIADKAQVLVNGVTVNPGGQSVDTQGGYATLNAAQGHLAVAQGAVLNVSAAGEQNAGQLVLQATQGGLDLKGQLLGTSSGQGEGASLQVDAASGVQLDQLADNIAAGTTGGLHNFAQSISVRSRDDEGLSLSQGKRLQAANIALVSDMGQATIRGELNADSDTGGSILVAAGKDLVVDGAKLSAQALSTSANLTQSAARIALQSALGHVQVGGGTQIKLGAAGNGTPGGILDLRAARTADGRDVKIDPIDATVSGARALHIEGVKVWDHVGSQAISTLDQSGAGAGALGLNAVLADANAFGSHASDIVTRLSGDDGTLADLMQVRAGEEVVATGKLEVNADWNINASLPVNLTVRAAGDLLMKGSLSAGFSTAAANGLALAGPAGDIRVVAGADTRSADLMSTNTAGLGDLSLGKVGSSQAVLLRSTTGDVQVAAAHDVRLDASGAAIYTSGELVDDTQLADFAATLSRSYFTPGTTRPAKVVNALTTSTKSGAAGKAYTALQGEFYTGGGNVSVAAGHDVLGADVDVLLSKPANWLYTNYHETVGQTAWWTRYDQFYTGVATLAGGNVSVLAGRDVANLPVAAAGSGFQRADNDSAVNFGAGTLLVSAGRDILGAVAVNTGDHAVLSAGGSIASYAQGVPAIAAQGSSLLHFGGVNQVSALGDIHLGALGDAVRASQYIMSTFGSKVIVNGALDSGLGVTSTLTDRYAQVARLGFDASVNVRSAGGDIEMAPAALVNNGVAASPSLMAMPSDWNASDLSMTAPSGSIVVPATLVQKFPADGGGLSLVAGNNLSVNAVHQTGAADGGANDSGSARPLGWDTSPTRSPVVLVAGTGDLTLGELVQGEAYLDFVRPVHAYAGRDITVKRLLTIQHQAEDEVSSFEAARDIRFSSLELPAVPGLVVRGPGDAVLAAGRDIDLGIGLGLTANGNMDNSALPKQSANLHLLAGTSLASVDANLALAEGRLPQLLGGLAFLTAQDAQAELSAVRAALALLGVSVDDFDASVKAGKAAFMGKLGAAYAGLSTDQRVSAFDGLSAELQGQFIKDYLSAHVLGEATSKTAASPQDFHLGTLSQQALLALAPEARADLALRLAQALNSPYLASLQAYMAQRTGLSDLSASQALAAFQALPVAQQVVFMDQVLYSELRQAGRSAVNAGSEAQKTADYQRGYEAMATLFSPAHAQAGGDILMPLTKVRNFQGGNINMLAPVGNVNGGLTSGTSTDFGVVAMGGGEVNAALHGNYLVNTSRVFTLGGGNLLMWSSEGNIDAGKGARTVASAPAPVFYLKDGKLQVDVTAAISGSGIASGGDLDVYAPHGIVDSGDAGLRSAGAASLGGARVVCLGCSFGGSVVGLPTAAPTIAPVAPVSALPDNTKAGLDAAESDEEKKKKKHKRKIELDFLGFGVAFTSPSDWMGVRGLSDWWAPTKVLAVTDTHTNTDTAPRSRPWLLSLADRVKQRFN